MSRFIAIANQKGGVGKTTTTVNLAASLASRGHRVLVLDMDPQGNTGSGLGVASNTLDKGIYEVLTSGLPMEEAVLPDVAPGVDLLPSGQRLIGAEVELVPMLARETILARALEPVRARYDFLLADCPPSLGLLTVNTLTAADSVLIPIQCEYYALEGLTQLLNAIRLIQQALNPRLEIEGILLTMYDSRLNLSREVAEEARKFFTGRVYETVIPRNVRLSEAPSFGQPVLLYDPECVGSQCYLHLADEVLNLPVEPSPALNVPADEPDRVAESVESQDHESGADAGGAEPASSSEPAWAASFDAPAPEPSSDPYADPEPVENPPSDSEPALDAPDETMQPEGVSSESEGTSDTLTTPAAAEAVAASAKEFVSHE